MEPHTHSDLERGRGKWIGALDVTDDWMVRHFRTVTEYSCHRFVSCLWYCSAYAVCNIDAVRSASSQELKGAVLVLEMEDGMGNKLFLS